MQNFILEAVLEYCSCFLRHVIISPLVVARYCLGKQSTGEVPLDIKKREQAVQHEYSMVSFHGISTAGSDHTASVLSRGTLQLGLSTWDSTQKTGLDGVRIGMFIMTTQYSFRKVTTMLSKTKQRKPTPC